MREQPRIGATITDLYYAVNGTPVTIGQIIDNLESCGLDCSKLAGNIYTRLSRWESEGIIKSESEGTTARKYSRISRKLPQELVDLQIEMFPLEAAS